MANLGLETITSMATASAFIGGHGSGVVADAGAHNVGLPASLGVGHRAAGRQCLGSRRCLGTRVTVSARTDAEGEQRETR